MKIKTINKISAFLTILITITAAADFVILQDGFSIKKAKAVELTRISPAYNKEFNKQIKSETEGINIAAEKFSVAALKNSGEFVKKSPIEIFCEIKNKSKTTIKNVHSVIRTSKGGFSIAKIETMAPEKSIILKSEFIPQESGVTITACRTDVDGWIEEENENDNREITAIYVR